jgi:glycerol kinase
MTVLAIDQGTTSTKAFLLKADGDFRSVGSITHRQFHPVRGWVEHDAEELALNIEALIDKAVEQEPHISGIALANQGETVVAWDRRTKKPLYSAIVWQDQRTQPLLDALSADAREYAGTRTGLPLDAYFSAAKLSWLFQNVPAAGSLAHAGHLGLGTSDAFFIDRLTDVYASDVTTASRTSLMDLRSCHWDAELCRIFGVPIELLPTIRPSTGLFGTVQRGQRKIPIVAAMVDQQAALFGHGCRAPGDAKVTFGTGSFAMMISGAQPVMDRTGMLPTVAWAFPGEPCVYALDGGDYTAAAAIEWAIQLGLANSLSDFDLPEGLSALERGLAFVPALAGLGAPYWDREASGLWIGLRQSTTAAEMRRAVLEGIALRGVELIESLGVSSDRPISIDGGLTCNATFVRLLADLLARPLLLRDSPDLTALGAAQLGFLSLGLDLPPRREDRDRLVIPSTRSTAVRSFRFAFSEAVEASRAFGRALADPPRDISDMPDR